MSTTADYVTFLTRNGVKLWIDNGQLRYHAKKGVLSREELTRLRSMKTEIIAELTNAEAPSSFQQQWFLRLLEAYPHWKATLGYTFHLHGALDAAALERSLEGIVRMHASLRAKVVRIDEQWRLQIEPSDGFHLAITEVSGESDPERRENALRLVSKSGARELDPAVAPLMTAQLIRVSSQEHFLVLLIHRLATDCLGTGQALRDLWILYAQTTQKGSMTGLQAPAPYRDYALWQQATDGAWRQKHATYWNDYLAGAQPVVWPAKEFASAATRPAPGKLACLESSLGVLLSAGLRALGEQTQTLPALVMLTLYVACLSIWCGQKDLAIPFIIAGRAAAHEGIVGCFSHVVYLRIQLEGGESFIGVLKRVCNEFYRAAAFRQDSGRMAMQRPELIRGTLCQWLSWHPADIAGSRADGLGSPKGLKVATVRCQSLEDLTNVPPDMVDLEINFFDAAGEISALAIYRADGLAEGVPARLMRELRSVAERVVHDPHAQVAGIASGSQAPG
jgi:Condensation domain/TubC N-terminal docking domain